MSSSKCRCHWYPPKSCPKLTRVSLPISFFENYCSVGSTFWYIIQLTIPNAILNVILCAGVSILISLSSCWYVSLDHDEIIKWEHFPRYWPFVRGIHRSPVKSLHKGQWRGALMLSLICAWINGWVNYREAGDWFDYDVTVLNGYNLAIFVFIQRVFSSWCPSVVSSVTYDNRNPGT